jgi:hypothetical protein
MDALFLGECRVYRGAGFEVRRSGSKGSLRGLRCGNTSDRLA